MKMLQYQNIFTFRTKQGPVLEAAEQSTIKEGPSSSVSVCVLFWFENRGRTTERRPRRGLVRVGRQKSRTARSSQHTTRHDSSPVESSSSVHPQDLPIREAS